jgi:hypothetical protein
VIVRSLSAALIFVSGCQKPHLDPPSSSPPSAPPAQTLATASAVPSSNAPKPESPQLPRAEPTPAAELGYTVERELDADVSDFAVGTPPTVAALSGLQVSLFDGQRWKALPKIVPSSDKLRFRLFFGRDNAPRLMGYDDGPEPRAFYRRFKGGRFQPEPAELGPLGAERGALYGVLGFTDPEVVCKPRELCLIKRISGWKRVPAHQTPVPIFLGNGGAWAFSEHGLQQLSDTGFVEFTPSQRFENPRALWVDAEDAPWVLDAAQSAVFHLAQGSWQRVDIPLEQPADLWGKAPNSVWIVGANGAAHFDGKSVRCVRELTGPLGSVMPAGDTLWFAGASGVFRARPLPAKK